jgi:zinc protease
MPAEYTPDAYPLALASNILSQGESSRLYRTLVYQDRIALQTIGFGNFTEDPNLFWVVAVMNQGHTNAEGQKALEAVLEEIKAKPVDAKELEKAKNQIASQFILGRQTVQEKATAIGNAAVLGKDSDLVNNDLERYLKVTPAEIERAAQEYFVKQHATVLLVTPPAAR